MVKRLAMTADGKLTYCSATEENVGKGRCNHIGHSKDGETQFDFVKRTEHVLEVMNRDPRKYKNIELRYGDKNFLENEFKDYNPDFYINSKNPVAREVAAENGVCP